LGNPALVRAFLPAKMERTAKFLPIIHLGHVSRDCRRIVAGLLERLCSDGKYNR
jgi:hypothetical protein